MNSVSWHSKMRPTAIAPRVTGPYLGKRKIESIFGHPELALFRLSFQCARINHGEYSRHDPSGHSCQVSHDFWLQRQPNLSRRSKRYDLVRLDVRRQQ